MDQLVGMPYSPWTEKARWALDHHRIAYRFHEHVPLLGEPLLRLRAPKGKKATVPLYLAAEGAIVDSIEIARYAEKKGTGSKLFEPKQVETIERWNRASESMLSAARGRIVLQLLADAEAQKEAIPGIFPKALHGVLLPIARTGTRFIAKKYSTSDSPDAEIERTAVPLLDAWRKDLGGRATLFDSFSYADITMALALQSLLPVSDDYLPVGAGTRRVWSNPKLAERYADLIAWRDSLYATYRRN